VTNKAEERILEMLAGRPMTEGEIVDALASVRPFVRMHLWYLVFADRKVTCDRDGRYRLGAPPDDWPTMTRIAP
jgi:hypothetical protein